MTTNVFVITTQLFIAEDYGKEPRSVDVSPSDTIYELKGTIQGMVGIPRERLTLHFCDEELTNARKLEDYPDIKDGASLYCGKVGDKKFTIVLKKRFPRKEIVASFRIKPDTTFLELKQKIEKRKGIPVHRQHLYFEDGDRFLCSDNECLTYFGTNRESPMQICLCLDSEPIELRMFYNGKITFFRATPNTTVGRLRVGIFHQLDLDIADRALLLNAKKELPMESTLKDNHIKQGDIISVAGDFYILIQGPMSREKYAVGVQPSDTIHTLQPILQHKLRIPIESQRIILDFEQLCPEMTFQECGVQLGDTINCMLSQSGMISNFTSKESDNPLTRWLMLADKEREMGPSLSYSLQNELAAAVKKAKATTEESFEISHTRSLQILSADERKQLIEFLDVAVKFFAPNSKDVKIALSDASGKGGLEAWSALCSLSSKPNASIRQAYSALMGLHRHPSSAKIALRRTEGPVEGCIGFHCDEGAKHTVQIALNDDSEYDGGKLCFVTRGQAVNAPKLELVVPKRYAGTVTLHGARVLHAVTQMHHGVRYGLFVVDRDIGLGENDVYCADAETIATIWETQKPEIIKKETMPSESRLPIQVY